MGLLKNEATNRKRDTERVGVHVPVCRLRRRSRIHDILFKRVVEKN